jgi:hypothetical protein
MTRRSQIIALQAAVVGVLLVVVYFTILRPNDDGSVSGVSGPGGPPTEVVTKPPHHARHHVKPRQPGNRPPQRSALRVSAAPGGVPSAGGAPTGLAPATPGTPASTPTGGNSPGGGPGGGSPTDDQYNGTLARLSAALR